MGKPIPKNCEFCATWETVDTEGTTICTNERSPLFVRETDDFGSCHLWAIRETVVRCNECGWIGDAPDLRFDGECPECAAPGTAISTTQEK